MSNLKEVRTRIASVQSTRQITSAMKMVAASKLRRAQNAILGMRPYAAKLNEIITNLSHDLESSGEGIWSDDRGEHKILIIPVTSNRGLCGAFNINVVKATVELIENKYKEQYSKGNLHIYNIGKKGADTLKAWGYKVDDVNSEILENLNFENTVVIAEQLMKDFQDKKYDKIIIIYNEFKNAAVQILREQQYLPVTSQETETVKEKEKEETEIQANYLFEPDKEQILAAIVPKSIKVQLYKALLDSMAAELGARMTAMHQATENADNMIKELRTSLVLQQGKTGLYHQRNPRNCQRCRGIERVIFKKFTSSILRIISFLRNLILPTFLPGTDVPGNIISCLRQLD